MPESPRNHEPGKDGPLRTLVVALVVSFCCAVLVAGSAILLRPAYQLNQEHNRQRNILAAAGLLSSGKTVPQLFQQVEPRIVDLSSGKYVVDVDPAAMTARSPISRENDIAFIRERPRYAVVYHAYDDERLSAIILPVYGYGLWSTMYGYIALEADANTIVGLRFYEHGETPGLGAEIDNSQWLGLWRGKKVYGDAEKALIEVVKGQVTAEGNSQVVHQVDGITGATLTGDGITNLLRFWLGEQGFGPYLQMLRKGSEENI